MVARFLLLVLVTVALGIVGAKGLLFLLFIAIVGFLGALVSGALRMRRRPGRSPAH